MVRRKRTGWRLIATLCGAYLLLLQAIVSGFVQGAQAAPMAGGDPLSVICHTDGSPLPATPDKPARTPACCLLGCPGMPAAAVAPETAQIALPGPAADFRAHAQPEHPAGPASVTAGFRARAPPAASTEYRPRPA